MPFVSAEDINSHLDQTKLNVNDLTSFSSENDSAERIIRAKLSGMVDTATFATWTTPTATPEIIREIASLLVAAQLYGRLYSEDIAETSSYAQTLYDRAMDLLNGIVTGAYDIIGVDVEASGSLTDMSFYPNNNAPYGEQRKFGMGQLF